MKLLCPRCRVGKEIGGASRYNVFPCDSCHFHFRGTHAEIAKWNRLFKQLFTFDTSTTYADRTPCPHCCGWVPVYTGDDGVACMYCGQGIRTSTVVNFTDAEIVELQRDFRVADVTPNKERQLRALLADNDFHPRDRSELERLLRQFRSTPAPSPAPKAVTPPRPESERRIVEFPPAVTVGEVDPLPEEPPMSLPTTLPPSAATLERTTKYVLLKVHVLHQPDVDPEVICEQAVFGYDYEDGAVEGVEVVGVLGVGEIEAQCRGVSVSSSLHAGVFWHRCWYRAHAGGRQSRCSRSVPPPVTACPPTQKGNIGSAQT